MNIAIFRGGKRWELQNILCQWENCQEKIIRCVFGKMEKMYIFLFKIKNKYIFLIN